MYIVSQYYLNVYEWRTEWNDEVTEKNPELFVNISAMAKRFQSNLCDF